jgi:hypothetical protein
MDKPIGQVILWNGVKCRPQRVQRPCECGCDLRDGAKGVGYITGSDSEGNGFSIWITDEKLFVALEKAFDSGRRKTRRA